MRAPTRYSLDPTLHGDASDPRRVAMTCESWEQSCTEARSTAGHRVLARGRRGAAGTLRKQPCSARSGGHALVNVVDVLVTGGRRSRRGGSGALCGRRRSALLGPRVGGVGLAGGGGGGSVGAGFCAGLILLHTQPQPGHPVVW